MQAGKTQEKPGNGTAKYGKNFPAKGRHQEYSTGWLLIQKKQWHFYMEVTAEIQPGQVMPLCNDMWAWNGDEWHKIAINGDNPGKRCMHAMAEETETSFLEMCGSGMEKNGVRCLMCRRANSNNFISHQVTR